MTNDLKKISKYTTQRKIQHEEKTTLLQKLSLNYNDARHNIHEKIHEISDRLNKALLHANELLRAYRENKEKHILEQLKAQEQKIQQEWKQWVQLRYAVIN